MKSLKVIRVLAPRSDCSTVANDHAPGSFSSERVFSSLAFGGTRAACSWPQHRSEAVYTHTFPDLLVRQYIYNADRDKKRKKVKKKNKKMRAKEWKLGDKLTRALETKNSLTNAINHS